jgi:hypothetical protein
VWGEAAMHNLLCVSAGMGLLLTYSNFLTEENGIVRYGILITIGNNYIRYGLFISLDSLGYRCLATDIAAILDLLGNVWFI